MQIQATNLLPPCGFGEWHSHTGLHSALAGGAWGLTDVPAHLHSEVVTKGNVGHGLGRLQHQMVVSVHAIALTLETLSLWGTNQCLHGMSTKTLSLNSVMDTFKQLESVGPLGFCKYLL